MTQPAELEYIQKKLNVEDWLREDLAPSYRRS